MIKRCIEEKKQGCYTKSHVQFNDEEVQLTIHECISSFVDKLSAQKLVKGIKYYLSLQTVINIIQEILKKESTLSQKSTKLLLYSLQIYV